MTTQQRQHPGTLPPSHNDDDGDIHLDKDGVRKYWSAVNHIAIVVSNVGRSLGFYANIIGMTQVLRPDFYRSARVGATGTIVATSLLLSANPANPIYVIYAYYIARLASLYVHINFSFYLCVICVKAL